MAKITVAQPINLDAVILKEGGHTTRSMEALCVMEAVAWVAGEPHSDHPQCACPVIGAFLRNWNDSLPDDATRTRLLGPLVPQIVNSKSTEDVELRRSYLALDWLARVQAPAWLSLRDDLKAHAVVLRGLAPLVDAKSCESAQPALAAAVAAARAAARAAAWDAAWDAAWAAAWAAARAAAWAAARAAAGDAAWDAAWAAAVAAAWAAAGDALAPTVSALQISALDLVQRMLAEGRA